MVELPWCLLQNAVAASFNARVVNMRCALNLPLPPRGRRILLARCILHRWVRMSHSMVLHILCSCLMHSALGPALRPAIYCSGGLTCSCVFIAGHDAGDLPARPHHLWCGHPRRVCIQSHLERRGLAGEGPARSV